MYQIYFQPHSVQKSPTSKTERFWLSISTQDKLYGLWDIRLATGKGVQSKNTVGVLRHGSDDNGLAMLLTQ